jgi:hypothetical protein
MPKLNLPDARTSQHDLDFLIEDSRLNETSRSVASYVLVHGHSLSEAAEHYGIRYQHAFHIVSTITAKLDVDGHPSLEKWDRYTVELPAAVVCVLREWSCRYKTKPLMLATEGAEALVNAIAKVNNLRTAADLRSRKIKIEKTSRGKSRQ